jgi:hypothetical protein
MILGHLESFNRKERFFVVGMALGNRTFSLCRDFRMEINRALRLDVPSKAFVAMDYHLDWLYASVYLQAHHNVGEVHDNLKKLIHAQQEDIDLVVAYQDGETCHIVLLEAKGVIGFTNKQMASKAARLGEIFGPKGDARPGVMPHFAIVSPREPQLLKTEKWPRWMLVDNRIPWIELALPVGLKKITRCTDQGVRAATGNHWKVDPV